MARFKPTLHKMSEVDGDAIGCQHILGRCLTCGLHGDLGLLL